MDVKTLLSALSLLGIGGALSIIIKYWLDSKKERIKKASELNEEKYRVILIYMSLVLSPENINHFILNDPVIIKYDGEDIRVYALSKLKEYFFHSILYASEEVLTHIKAFLQNPTREEYVLSAIAMRKDLWKKNFSIDVAFILK